MILFSVMTAISCKQEKIHADLIITNASIYSVDSSMNIAESMAIENGKILAIGKTVDIISKYKANKTLDAKGKFIYPGLIDAHCHFYGYAMTQYRYANLVGTKSFDEILRVLKKFAEGKNENEWILGRGWDQNDWQRKSFPTKEKLDVLFPNNPVILIRIDGHAILANSLALKKVGFDINTKIIGGNLQSANGRLTGVLLDNAADSLTKLIPALYENDSKKALVNAQKDCFSVGLTTVVDAGLEANQIELINQMQKDNILKMRIYAMLSSTEENFKKYVEKGIYKTPFLHIQSVKLYADGALGSRGACLLESYSDDIKNYGLLLNSPEKLRSFLERIYKAGYQANSHAIGDSAARILLNLYADILKVKNDRRWRIEHAQVINKNDFHYFGDYNIIPAVNTTHATSDMFWADERLGFERLKYAYAYKMLLQQNGWLTNGSDFPIESINPIYGFYAAVARKNIDGLPENGFQIENSLSREEALKAMTIWAAKGCFEENEKGSLEVGKLADFVVLDSDIMKISISEVPSVKVLKTFVGGLEVFSFKK